MTNNALPIAAFRDLIVEAVASNQVVIITAETGAGKSTQVPQYLLEAGHKIVVTQPRRLAAKVVAERVAEEFGTPLGEVVGFRTAYEHVDSRATDCLFVTDELALVRELIGAGNHSVLIADEVHEWNLNLEVLVAWAKHRLQVDPNFKLVLMSATMEAEKLSCYFDGAPVISVPGRSYPVTDQDPGGSIYTDVAELLRSGRNVLVFQPGKREIGIMIERLKLAGINADILPLHGELDSNEQAKCFRRYTRPKCIVSTNVAQTSITIADIDAVVDSGTERRIELVDGVEGLYLKPVSLADSAQRKGRAGRTKSGIYIDWCEAAWDDRPEFPVAEILRARLDQTVLRLSEAGFDAEELEFFHQPPKAEIHEAKRALRALGCMDASNEVTRIGRTVARLPVSVQYARMIVEAERLGVVDDVVTVAAILEQGGINARVCESCKRWGERDCVCWHKLIPNETASDALAQLALYHVAKDMQTRDMIAKGIFAKAYRQAREKRAHLVRSLRGRVKFGTSGRRDAILQAICAGMVDHLYENSYGTYRNGDGINRSLVRESVVSGADWIVGQPWDLQITTKRGPAVLMLVRMASEVNPSWLVELAPHLVEIKTGSNPVYDPQCDEVVSTTEELFNGRTMSSQQVLDPAHVEANRLRREGRNTRQWDMWVNKPAIDLPNLADGQATIPDIRVETYGSDAETGEPLLAYGIVEVNDHRYYSADPWFTVLWTKDAVLAEEHRELAQLKLMSLQEDFTAQQEQRRRQEEIRLLVEAIQSIRTRLYGLMYSSDLPVAMCSQLSDAYYNATFASTKEAIQQWKTTTESLLAEADELLATIRAQKARLVQEAVKLRERAGRLLDDHESEFEDARYSELEWLQKERIDDMSVNQLTDWIQRSEHTLDEADDIVRQTADSVVDVSALMARFNNH